jgi:cyclophilin family peptidyl-prolyl cis-trans isomerase
MGKEGENRQRIIFELYSKMCPKTSENFKQLCTGENPNKLTYKGSPIHRIVRNGWIQGGDIVDGTGLNSQSATGQTFPDESFAIAHDRAGILSMCSNGPHTNGSQYFITLKEIPFLDGKKVAFGRVIVGLEVLTMLNNASTRPGTGNQRPLDPIVVAECGVINMPKEAPPASGWLSLKTDEEKKAEAAAKAAALAARPQQKATIVVVGLDNAGKSSIVNHFKGEPGESVMPTWGFELDDVVHDNFDVKIFGLGGGAKIRGYWENCKSCRR